MGRGRSEGQVGAADQLLDNKTSLNIYQINPHEDGFSACALICLMPVYVSACVMSVRVRVVRVYALMLISEADSDQVTESRTHPKVISWTACGAH